MPFPEHKQTTIIQQRINDSIQLKQQLLNNDVLLQQVEQLTSNIVSVFQQGGKVLFCGNGGSAADAQHLAGELSGRFYYDRPPLFAEAISSNIAYLTAVSNDYGYQESFARMIKGMGRKGDILIALSTSGNSPNVVEALNAAKEADMFRVGMTGASGGKMNDCCDLLIKVPSEDTPRIQECHMLLGHIFCEMVEATLFPR